MNGIKYYTVYHVTDTAQKRFSFNIVIELNYIYLKKSIFVFRRFFKIIVSTRIINVIVNR